MFVGVKIVQRERVCVCGRMDGENGETREEDHENRAECRPRPQATGHRGHSRARRARAREDGSPGCAWCPGALKKKNHKGLVQKAKTSKSMGQFFIWAPFQPGISTLDAYRVRRMEMRISPPIVSLCGI